MQSQGLALRCKNFSRRACHLHTGNVLASSNFKTKESIKGKDKNKDRDKDKEICTLVTSWQVPISKQRINCNQSVSVEYNCEHKLTKLYQGICKSSFSGPLIG